jgi:hypothetical protein
MIEKLVPRMIERLEQPITIDKLAPRIIERLKPRLICRKTGAEDD